MSALLIYLLLQMLFTLFSSSLSSFCSHFCPLKMLLFQIYFEFQFPNIDFLDLRLVSLVNAHRPYPRHPDSILSIKDEAVKMFASTVVVGLVLLNCPSHACSSPTVFLFFLNLKLSLCYSLCLGLSSFFIAFACHF